MVFELFASKYGWSKEYILDCLTIPQIILYLEYFSKRLNLEFGGADMNRKGKAIKKNMLDINSFSASLFELGYEKKGKP